jgi:hypothetical protein
MGCWFSLIQYKVLIGFDLLEPDTIKKFYIGFILKKESCLNSSLNGFDLDEVRAS